MKKGLTTLLVILLAVGAMLVSCKAEVGTPADELVSVSFEEAASRSITATLEAFNKDNYYWKYAAQKADDSGLTSGATVNGALPVSAGNKGLGSGTGTDYKPYKVPGFSQGLWNFKLWAYRDSNYSDLLFYGEAENVSLSRGGKNMAKVTVNPVSEGNGYIKLAEGDAAIKFIPKKDADKTTAKTNMFVEVTNPDGSAVSGISYDDTNKRYVVPAGIYKVTVKFANAAQTIMYGEGYVIATVYSGLTTTIGGDLNELITYAQFDADLNPDAVNVQAESAAVTLVLTDTPVKIESKEGAEKQVVANVARSDANAIITEMAAAQAVDTGADTKLKLTLNVDPTDASEQSVTYEIGMKATLTYTKASETQTTEKPVTSLTNYVIVEIEMSSGLSSVTVKHSGTPMYPCTTKGQLDTITTEQEGYSGFYFYDPAGTLYIKTRTFSPFEIKYKAPANYVADVDGVKYGTLAEAVAQVKDAGTSTVTLLADVALTSTVETTKTFTLDLNGFNITAADCRAIWLKEGKIEITGKGMIAANKVDSTSDFKASSSVIRVGVSEVAARAELTIGADVTVSSDYCYGVTVFGKNSPYNILTVNGKIKVTGTASAISGNGSPDLEASGIYINAGAEVYSENDYAIYHPGKGNLTINGGKIIGKGGIEVKGGEVIINGGEIMATAPETTHEKNNDGTSTSGYALAAVENSGYQGKAEIFVYNVNVPSIKGPIEAIKDDEASFDANIVLRGGTYTVNPWKYVADGYEANYDSASKLWVVTYFDGSHPGAVAKVVYASGIAHYYGTLQAAIDDQYASAEGSRVELLRNIDQGLINIKGKSITLEGNFHSIAASNQNVTNGRTLNVWGSEADWNSGAAAKEDYIAPKVILRNLSIVGPSGSAGTTRGLNLGYRIDVDVENCEITCAYYGINAFATSNIRLVIKNSNVTAWGALNLWSNGVTVDAYDSSFIGINDKGLGPSNRFSTICLEGDTTKATALASSNIQLRFTNCKVSATQTTGNIQALVGFNSSKKNGAESNSVEFVGCDLIIGENCTLYYDYGTGNTLVIDGVRQFTSWDADFSDLVIEDKIPSGSVSLIDVYDETNVVVISISDCVDTPWEYKEDVGVDYTCSFVSGNCTYLFDLDVSDAYADEDGYHLYIKK